MPATPEQANKQATISDADSDRRYLIEDGDDRFVRTGRQIVDHCHLGISVEVWLEEVKTMREHVHEWCAGKDSVKACYLVPRGSCIALFVVPKSVSFDFDLADALVSLDQEVHARFNVGPVEFYQVPSSELNRFIPEDMRRRSVFGDAPASPSPVGT